MSEELFTYSEVQNLGFFTNPNLQDSQLKAMSRREQLLQGAYYYANSDRDDECRAKSAEIFGRGTIPLTDKENSAYFLGHAVLLESGYTGSPFKYFLQQDMDLPPEVTDEDTARIYIGNKVLNDMRAAYDKNKQDETILADVQNNLSGFLAPLVRMPSGYTGQPTDKDVADALNRMGVWDKISPSVDRARIAWLRMQHVLQDVDHMQEAGRPELAEIADELSDDKGQLDEMAVLAFYSALEQYAIEKQSDDSKFWATFSNSFENFIDRAIDETIKDVIKEKSPTEQLSEINQAILKAARGDVSDLIVKFGLTSAEAADSEQLAKLKRLYNDPRIERMRGIMQSAMHTAMEPSEQASTLAKIGTETGRLFGDSIIPMAGAIAATALTKGRGIGLIGQAAAGWAGGLAVSKDSIINQAVAQAYLEGVENPEEYGYYAGLGQAAAENIAGVGTSGFLLFKGVNRFMTKAAAKATTSKFLSNAYARATLAWAATTGIEGSLELSEEEMGAWLGTQFNALARATGTKMSEQEYHWWETIGQMKPHQIASMYVFAGALGLGSAAANFTAAQEMSIDIGKLKAVGYSDKKAREVQAHGIVTARKIETVNNSDATAEEKKAQIAAIQDERLEYLGKTFREDVVNASNEELAKRSKEENAEFTYRSLLAWAIQNGLDEQALIDLGYLSAKRQPNGNYLLTYEEKGEGENAQPKFVQKEWNRDQLHGFMLFQRGTDAHRQLRELAGQLMAMQFAEKVASVEELKIKLANLRDTPITELATIMQHEAITPELFKAFAEKEAANIAADIAQGMTRQQAEMEPSKLLPGVPRKDVIQAAKAAEERKQNAIAKDEIKPGQAVEYPGLNISRFDGTTLVAFFNQKITLSQMLEEMMEARLNQQAKNDPELYNKLGTILQGIQNKLKGVQILPKGKATFSRSDIVEAYSHLAVAEVIANPAYTSHLSQREQAIVQDVLGSVFRAQRYKAIAGAWLNYKESAEGKAYLENGGKDLVDIFSEAGFTFGKHLEAKQATEEQKMKALEARNFLPDFNEETKLLENKAEAEQKLAEVNAKEAQEPTVIPANESVTGEEIIITPEQKEAEQATTIDQPQPDTSSWSKAEQISYNAYQNIINGTAKVNDYAIYLYYNPMSDAEATQRGIRTLNQDGEENPIYTQGKRLSIFRDGKYSHADGQDRDVLTGEVRTKDIVHSPEVPQFKTNKSGHKADDKGVVYSLPGTYRMHDPIHIWQRTDGTLVVISGRHRLQKAIEAGAEFIPATVFPEVTGRDAAWARMHDFEQNVLDNQASVADTALYVQGVNPKNRKLTEEETKQFTRKGSNSEYGTYIGLHGSSELIAYLAGGAISPDYAYQIAQIAPDNQAAQKVAIDVLVFGDKGIMEAKNAAKIYLDNQQLRGTELFQSLGGAERQEAFMRFLSAYAANKIRMLGRGKRVHSAAKTDKSIREHEAAGIKFDDAASNRAKLNELNAAQEAWRNIGTHPELLEEAKAEFDKTDEGAQQYFDFGGNFSIIGVNAKTWDKYDKAGLTFKGRDDGKMRAEIDDSKAKVNEDLITSNNSGLRLGDVLEHKELYKAYPPLKNFKVIVRPLGGKSIAACDWIYGEIHIDPQWKTKGEYSLKEILLHESQHYIQHLENFVGGSDFSDVRNEFERYKQFYEKKSFNINPYGGRDFMADWLNADSKAKTMLLDLIKLAKNKASKEELTAAKDDYNKFAERYRESYVNSYWDLIPNETRKKLKPANYNIPKLTSVKLETIERIKGKLDSIPERKKTFAGLLDAITKRTEELIEQNDKRERAIAAISGKSDAGLYLRKAGEVEARAVQKRVNYTDEERKNIPFNEDLEYLGETWGFSIQAASLPDRFAGHPLAERMSNFMRTEARRYERTLSKQTPEDAATNALYATHSIIGAINKYVENGEFKLPRESITRLNHMRALLEKYAQMMKFGRVRSFNKIDKAEQAELLAAMAEAAAGIDADAINAMTPEEYAALKAEVEAEMKPELYRKHARALADDVAKSSYSTPAEITKRMKALAQAAKTGFTNQGLTNEDLQESGYNSQPDASTRQTVLKEYAKDKLAELEQAEEANRKEFESNKAQTLSALHRIMSEGRIADNITLGEVEQRQLTELVENEAQDAIEKEARNREFKLTADKIQQDAKERNERMVRVAATGRIGELLRDMLNETADIVDLYLKTELLKKLKRITDSVKIKRSPSKTLKGKMGAAEYRRMDAIVELMEMSARAKDNALGEIENARRILNESKGEIPEVAVGSLLWEIMNGLKEQGISVSVDTLNIELNNREADINVFANLDGMNYAEALNAARGLAGLIYFGRTAWQMKQAAEYERIKAFLDYFYEHTDSELGTSQAIEKGKKKKIGNIFNSSMNDAQLLFALAGHEGLRPVMDEMRRKLAMAQDARNLHIKSITNQIYATYARLIGMKPQTEAGYTDKQLRESSNKFSMEFEKWNETGKPNVVREWIDNDGVLKKQEMELSRLQALDLILTYRQQHYQPNADKHGYTEAVLNKLEEYCGTRLMAMGEAFKRTIQNDGTAQVYEERTGIPMYKDPSYWPGSININTINLTSEEPLVNPYNPAGTYNRLKQRVKNTNEAKYQNAFEKWKHAIAEGANYIYLYPITNTLNRMLAHREFANRLHGLIGSDLFSQLRLMLNVLDSSTWQETALRDEANNWAASMLKATAPAVLALNPGTLARQLSAINNYAMLPGIRISRLPALIALIKQDKSAIKLSDIMQLDSFRARYRDNAEVNDMLGLGPNAKFSAYNKWAKAGMNIIDRLDIWSNAVSACLYYNMLYEQMQEKNQGAANPLSEEEIRNICEQNVSQLLRLVAQPLEKANKSAMYWKYGNTWMGSIFLYMSTEMVNKTGMLRATYIKNKAEGMPFYKNAWQLMYKMGLGLGGMTFLIEAALFLLLSGDLPDDEKEWLAALFSLAIYSAFGQYLSRIPFIGSVTDYYLSPYGQYATSKSQQQNPALSIDKTSAKLLKMMSDNKHYSASEWQVAYTSFVRDLTAVSGVASGLVPQAQWISTTTATLQSLSAAMNTVYPVARSVQMDSWMRDITPDWYKPKKTKKRTKSALEEALTPEPEKKKGRKSK